MTDGWLVIVLFVLIVEQIALTIMGYHYGYYESVVEEKDKTIRRLEIRISDLEEKYEPEKEEE